METPTIITIILSLNSGTSGTTFSKTSGRFLSMANRVEMPIYVTATIKKDLGFVAP